MVLRICPLELASPSEVSSTSHPGTCLPTPMLTILTQSVGYSLTPLSSKAPARMRTAVMSFDQEAFIAESKEMRLKHLEEQVSARVSWEWEQGRWL